MGVYNGCQYIFLEKFLVYSKSLIPKFYKFKLKYQKDIQKQQLEHFSDLWMRNNPTMSPNDIPMMVNLMQQKRSHL